MTGAPLPWAANPFQSTEFLLTVGLLAAILLGGAVVLFIVDRWRKRQLAETENAVESLTSFRTLYERGDLTEAEYQAVRDKMATRVKQEVAAANPGAAAPLPGPAAAGGGESAAGGEAARIPDSPPG
jgi:hypothetical protein